VDEIKTRKEKLHQSGAKNQTEFNKVCHQLNFKLMKTRILIFNDFDEIIRHDFQYISQIKYILTNCNDVGVKIMFIATHVTGEILNENIYDNIVSKFILKLEYENESLQIFDNYRAFQLFGNGDGYFLAQDNKRKTRFQTCYLNQNELNRIVKIINVFYQAKND
jgi:DNA segregation ATPase FtsK/SpoIIIE-like protein